MTSFLSHLLHSVFIARTYVSPRSTDLTGKIVVITGSGGAVGSAITKVLTRANAQVVKMGSLFSHDPASIRADVTSEASVKASIHSIISRYGRIDVLINNAGVFSGKTLESVSIKDFDNVLSVNVKGPFLLSKFTIPHMKKQGSGLIVNIGSKISHNTHVTPGKVVYATSKYALEGFSFALGRELRQYGIRVSCLMPGTINTFFSRQSHNYLSPYDIGEIISFMIKFDQIDFESIVIKSLHQDI